MMAAEQSSPGPPADVPGIRTIACPDCYVCGAPGRPFYEQLPDRLFGVPGQWSLNRCEQPACGLVWLNPRPVDEDLPRLYENYYTHQHGAAVSDPLVRLQEWVSGIVLPAALRYAWGDRGRLTRWLGRLLARFGPVREHACSGVFWLEARRGGRLLDVGCGSGQFLGRMCDLGWEVAGVEPDPVAARVAARRFHVTAGTLEQARLPEGHFDVVTMSHVVEHLPDPVTTLRECRRILRPGGRLLLYTPNAASMGSRTFGRHWVAWDPPRHLLVFTPEAVRRTLARAGFEVERVQSLSRTAWWTWRVSQQIRARGRFPGGTSRFQPWYAPCAGWFCLKERARCRTSPVGEELFASARKPL
jgi:2-polyprenyl-3-methyl-5-hydroxy-6-metoxy-1,4-benzoquinol methylase